MTEYSTITQLISNLGFPIVAFLLMWHLANKTIKENTNVLRKLKTKIELVK